MTNRKGERTKELIVRKASAVFNCQGYMASSISDIMHETGLGKGGIYNHFESKEELMLAAFAFSLQTMGHFYAQALAGKHGCAQSLLSLASVFEQMAQRDVLPGGCPIMNAAIEADDAIPLLLEKASEAMTHVSDMVRLIVNTAMKTGEVAETVDTEYVTTVFISTLEGALMLSKLYRDATHMTRAIKHLKSFFSMELGLTV